MGSRQWIWAAIGGFLLSLGHRASGQELQGGLRAFEPFLGVWRIDAKWQGGPTLEGVSVNKAVLDGQFVEMKTWVRDGGGPWYQRYHAMLRYDREREAFVSHEFVYDGSTRENALRLDESAEHLRTEWSMGEMAIKEEIGVPAGDSYSWKVWVSEGASEPRLAMDAEWVRAPASAIPRLEGEGLDQRLAPVEDLIGTWEVRTRWKSGEALWALLHVEAGERGGFLHSITLAKDGDGEPYERYRGFVVPTDNGLEEVTFSYRGEVQRAKIRATPGEGGTRVVARTERDGSPVAIVRTMDVDDAGFDWRVEMDGGDGAGEGALIEARWRRVGGQAMSYPIDAALFVGEGSELRSFKKEVVIDAPVSATFGAWASAEGWKGVYGLGSSDARANIELAIGGRYEWLFDGVLGSNGCQVLSYIPDRMLSFSWNAPPSLAKTRMLRTWVVVEFEALSETQTRILLTHLGFGEGAEWDETYSYFDNAWSFVLGRMKAAMEDG